ncbi:MAG TPA: DUF1800 domain-containing protein [Drouetiella sp.]
MIKHTLLTFSIFLAATAPGMAKSFKVTNSTDNCLHALDRLTFGPRPGDVEAVKKMGVEKFIKEQLKPDSIDEDPKIVQFVSNSPALNLSATQLYNQFGQPAIKQAKIDQQLTESDDDKKKLNMIRNDLTKKAYDDVPDAKLMRAICGQRQLEEVMTDFWYNHFNVYYNKGQDQLWIGAYEQQAIRPFVLGKFRDILGATCHHPAMLFYLDNWQNTTPGVNKRGAFAGLNENYARELMELHTLGVDGGYSQKDVTELARVLTGLGLPNRDPKNANLGELGAGYYFDDRRHDHTGKTVMSQTIAPAGEQEIEQMLDFLASNPATAHHISYQLAQYFVCDNPPDSLVNKLSERFLKSKGDIKAVLTELFKSPEFWDPQYFNSKYKSPFRYVVSSLRASNIQPTDYKPLEQFCRSQGMQLYGCLTPDGYKNTRSAWLNPDSLIRRTSFASSLVSGKYKGSESAPVELSTLSTAVGDGLSLKTQNAVAKAPNNLKSAMVLGSPDFMRY